MSAILPPPLDINHLLGSPSPRLDFVLPGLVAGHVGALVAPGSTGKSFLELQIGIGIAAAVPIAEGAFPTTPEPRRVVMLAGEDDARVLAQRIHAIVDHLTGCGSAMGSPFPTIDRALLVDRLSTNLTIYPLHGTAARLHVVPGTPSLPEQLRTICAGARLLVIDPLRRFHSGDENDAGVMTELVQTCERIVSGTDCAALVAHHTNKAATLNGHGDLQQAVRGSSALTDAIRWQANLVRMTAKEGEDLGVAGDERAFFVRLELAKANYVAPQPTLWMRRLAGGVLTKVELRAPKTSSRRVNQSAR